MLGLSAILVQYQWLTWTVRVLGGAYLIYLGIRLLMSNASAAATNSGDAPAKRNALLFGFLVTLTNPKAIVLFASVFSTAVIRIDAGLGDGADDRPGHGEFS